MKGQSDRYILRTISLFFIIIAQSLAVLNLNAANQVALINSIKQQPEQYYFAESTASTSEEALTNASLLLTDIIYNDLDTDLSGRRAEAESMAKEASVIEASRGRLKRIFLYVVRPNANQVNNLSETSVSEEDYDIDSTPIDSSKGIEENTSINQPLEKEDENSIIINLSDSGNNTHVEAETIVPLARKMFEISRATDIESFIKNLKQSGEISKFGRLKTLPDNGRSYIFIFDKDSQVVAYLMKQDHIITDLKSGNEQTLDTYKGCGCIWFQ